MGAKEGKGRKQKVYKKESRWTEKKIAEERKQSIFTHPINYLFF